MIKTVYQYRIKDSTSRKHLKKIAGVVNFVWNYCNEANKDSWDKFGKPLSGYDLQKLTKGCSKDLNIPSQVIQLVCQEYALRCKQYKKRQLKWRTGKRNLGWIPYNYQSIKVEEDICYFNGKAFRFWKSREIDGKIKCGYITEDSRGRWYLNLTLEKEVEKRLPTGKAVGIDLGLKTIATLSTGESLSRPNYTREYAEKLAIAQRARKKKQVTAIHSKIKNKRKDWNKKAAKQLCDQFDTIVVGNVNSSFLAKTNMAKSVYDASWYAFKSTLGTTAIKRGVDVRIVNESGSTITCSVCGSKSGPSGLSGLSVREWKCNSCGTAHARDVNAAINILNSVQGIGPYSGIPTV